jgi:site-specific DNA-methyltransferase (adenine-specific)
MGGLGGQRLGKNGGNITAPATDAARQWEGWGTALKPACELIVLARKPLSEGTVAANVLRWGTGAINVDGCRISIAGEEITPHVRDPRSSNEGWVRPWMGDQEKVASGQMAAYERMKDKGRWPANVVHDGSDEVVAAFPETDGGLGGSTRRTAFGLMNDDGWPPSETVRTGFDDSGSAARYFYTAKADSDDRLGSKHPTVKPLDLMQWLVRLITPPKGTCLDPFAGTGTTGEAAWREGMSAVLIEREAEYQGDIRRRMKLCLAGPEERARESIRAKLKDKPRDDGPLFGGASNSRDLGD